MWCTAATAIYSLIDSRRGRVFTYDHEGNLLYIFGGLGTQRGTFTTPVAIEAVGGNILVLDAFRAAILVFGETEYGALINDAVALRYDGDETLAVAKWEAVLALDELNELANVGIGKAYLAAGDNEQAMVYLKRGMNKSYYSVAFKRYRNAILRENLGLILTVCDRAAARPDYICTGAQAQQRQAGRCPAAKAAQAKPQQGRGARVKTIFSKKHWKTLLHTAGHPADGYYWIRHQDTGSVGIALLLVVLFSLSFSLNRMYASFVVSDINPRTVSSLEELGGVLLLFVMLCVGNWSVYLPDERRGPL